MLIVSSRTFHSRLLPTLNNGFISFRSYVDQVRSIPVGSVIKSVRRPFKMKEDTARKLKIARIEQDVENSYFPHLQMNMHNSKLRLADTTSKQSIISSNRDSILDDQLPLVQVYGKKESDDFIKSTWSLSPIPEWIINGNKLSSKPSIHIPRPLIDHRPIFSNLSKLASLEKLTLTSELELSLLKAVITFPEDCYKWALKSFSSVPRTTDKSNYPVNIESESMTLDPSDHRSDATSTVKVSLCFYILEFLARQYHFRAHDLWQTVKDRQELDIPITTFVELCAFYSLSIHYANTPIESSRPKNKSRKKFDKSMSEPQIDLIQTDSTTSLFSSIKSSIRPSTELDNKKSQNSSNKPILSHVSVFEKHDNTLQETGQNQIYFDSSFFLGQRILTDDDMYREVQFILRRVQASENPLITITCWHFAIEALLLQNRITEAERELSALQRLGLTPTGYTFDLLIQYYANHDDLDPSYASKAMILKTRMEELNMSPDAASYAALVGFYERSSRYRELDSALSEFTAKSQADIGVLPTTTPHDQTQDFENFSSSFVNMDFMMRPSLNNTKNGKDHINSLSQSSTRSPLMPISTIVPMPTRENSKSTSSSNIESFDLWSDEDISHEHSSSNDNNNSDSIHSRNSSISSQNKQMTSQKPTFITFYSKGDLKQNPHLMAQWFGGGANRRASPQFAHTIEELASNQRVKSKRLRQRMGSTVNNLSTHNIDYVSSSSVKGKALKMSKPLLKLWASSIHRALQMNSLRRALHLVEELRRLHLPLNEDICYEFMRYAGRSRDLNLLEHWWMQLRSFVREPPKQAYILYIKQLILLNKIEQAQVASQICESKFGMIDGLAAIWLDHFSELNDTNQFNAFLDELISTEHVFQVFTMSTFMKHFSREGNFLKAIEWFEKMKQISKNLEAMDAVLTETLQIAFKTRTDFKPQILFSWIEVLPEPLSKFKRLLDFVLGLMAVYQEYTVYESIEKNILNDFSANCLLARFRSRALFPPGAARDRIIVDLCADLSKIIHQLQIGDLHRIAFTLSRSQLPEMTVQWCENILSQVDIEPTPNLYMIVYESCAKLKNWESFMKYVTKAHKLYGTTPPLNLTLPWFNQLMALPNYDSWIPILHIEVAPLYIKNREVIEENFKIALKTNKRKYSKSLYEEETSQEDVQPYALALPSKLETAKSKQKITLPKYKIPKASTPVSKSSQLQAPTL